jgi:hypothetical protein
MTHTQAILALMSDGQPRTSYAICDALHGPQPDGARWWRVGGSCDWLVQRGRLFVVGTAPRVPGSLGWTMYQI